jgi:hypothetical protein
MNLFRLLSAFGLAVLLSGCSSEPPTVGTATDFSAVCDRANDGKRVAVDGFLIFPSSFTESTSVMMLMHESDDFAGDPIGVQIPFGTSANQVEEVGDQFSDDDMQLHLADNSVVGFRTPVTVSGKVYFPVVDQEFACALENPLFEQAGS